jgi:RNA polymerase sigma-70 factor, ECF subfamily
VKTPSLAEQQAIARLKQGDLGGLEALVQCYQVQAVYAAYLIVRDLKSAEDIVQDAFLRAAEKIGQFDETRPFGGWFLRSVVNASLKAAEREKRLIPLDGPRDEDASRTAAWLLDPDPCPEYLAETEETRRLVWKALGELTPDQRAAIILRHFLEMNETEMTVHLGRPLTTVRWRLKTARSRLRKILQPFWKAEVHEVEDEERD